MYENMIVHCAYGITMHISYSTYDACRIHVSYISVNVWYIYHTCFIACITIYSIILCYSVLFYD